MTAICDAAIHLCKVRLTRLDAVGHPVAGPNNSYVTDNPMDLIITPSIETGDDRILKGGCGCIVAAAKDPDLLKRFDLELTIGRIEPALEEMLTGAAVILHTGDPIGVWFPTQVTCADTPPPLVAIEGWQDLRDENGAPDPTYPFLHWIFPASKWQRSAVTLQNDFLQPKFVGFTQPNSVWGTGIYGDQPEAAGPQGGYFFAATTPVASCGYLSHALT